MHIKYVPKKINEIETDSLIENRLTAVRGRRVSGLGEGLKQKQKALTDSSMVIPRWEGG